MKRREFIALFGGAALVSPMGPRPVMAQPAMPVVALINGAASNATGRIAAAFRKGLSETGFTEGHNVTVEYHWLDGHYETLPKLLTDLVQRRVTVIATPGSSSAAVAAKSATAALPIVFGVGEDPVALGLVASLARPGGNATGINTFAYEINAKRLGLMHELLPGAHRFAVMVNPSNGPSASAITKELEQAAHSLGLDSLVFKAGTSAEIDAAFAAFARERIDALLIAADFFFASRGVQLATLAARDRLPASFVTREMVEAGLLMSYGSSIGDMFRQVGIYVGSVLKGAKPAELPVLQSTKIEFVLNLQTARSLNLEIPPMLLASADEVIE